MPGRNGTRWAKKDPWHNPLIQFGIFSGK